MAKATVRDWIRTLERADQEEQWALLCFLALRHVALDDDELNAALRRAELLLVAGGNPRRPLELYGRAVTAIARDLDTPAARAQLREGLDALVPEVEGLRGASEALRLLRNDDELAWQCSAMALLAEELAGEE